VGGTLVAGADARLMHAVQQQANFVGHMIQIQISLGQHD